MMKEKVLELLKTEKDRDKLEEKLEILYRDAAKEIFMEISKPIPDELKDLVQVIDSPGVSMMELKYMWHLAEGNYILQHKISNARARLGYDHINPEAVDRMWELEELAATTDKYFETGKDFKELIEKMEG